MVAGWYRREHLAAAVPGLEPRKAEQAIREHIAKPLNLSLEEAALGIFRIAVNNMVEAMRLASVSRGFDPREFTLAAYGGAGGAFAAAVAEALSIGEVLVPPHPGVGAAAGLLRAPPRYEFKATLWAELDQLDYAAVSARFEEMTKEAQDRLSRDGLAAEQARVTRWAECRYAGQGHELAVETPCGEINAAWAGKLRQRFHAEHQRACLRACRGTPVRVINLGVSAWAPGAPLASQEAEAAARTQPQPLLIAGCLFPGASKALPTAFYRRAELQFGHQLAGPAIVEQADATTVVPPGWSARVDRCANLLLTPAAAAEQDQRPAEKRASPSRRDEA